MSSQQPRSFSIPGTHHRASAFRNFTAQALRRLSLVVLFMALPAILFYGYLGYSETGSFPRLRNHMAGYFCSVAIGMITGLTLFSVNRVLDRRIPWMDHFTSRFLAGLAANLAIVLILLAVLTAGIAKVLGSNVFWSQDATDDPDVRWKVAILAFLFIFIYQVIYTLLYAYQHYAVTQLSQLEQERKQLELQFEALKSQISPHYLFNSLNTISALLMKDLPSAEQFIRRLAQTYQYVLATQDKKFVILREEVEFVQSYYYLLRMRFQQQLHVEVNIPSRIMDTWIPPLTLQMLVENAVKHNTFTGDHKLLIYITTQDNTWLKVMNTKGGSADNVHSFHMGLENIRQRYKYLTERPLRIENKDKFVVSLPVIYLREQTQGRKHSA